MLKPLLGAADAAISTEIGGLRYRAREDLCTWRQASIIATDDRGESRALIDGASSGYLVAPYDGAAIAARVLDLKSHPRPLAC